MLHRNIRQLVFNLNTNVSWLPDSSGIWFREESANAHRFIVVDAESGVRRQAFDHDAVAVVLSEVLKREVLPDALPFDSLDVGSNDDWVVTIEGDRWRFNNDGLDLEKLDEAQSTSDSQNVSPSSRYTVESLDGNLRLADRSEGSLRELTDDAEAWFGYGSSPEGRNSAVSERLAGLTSSPCVLFSPDERSLVTHRLDERSVDQLHLWQGSPPDGSVRPQIHSYRQALPGDQNLPLAQLVIFDCETGRKVDVDWPELESPFLTPLELGHVWWAEDSETVLFLVWSRDRCQVQLVGADRISGACEVLVEESAETPVDLNALYYGKPNVWVSGETSEIVWYSTRSGWGHLYLIDGDGDERPLTEGDWAVTDLVRVDEASRLLYFMATARESNRDPYFHHLYSVGLDGGAPVLLTPEDAEHGEWPPWVHFSPNGEFFVDRFSTIEQPPVTVLRRSTGELVARISSADVGLLVASKWTFPQRFSAFARDGSTVLSGMIVLPYDFDPDKKYPVIENIYPGPQVTRTPRGFSDVVGDSTRCFADLGFIVVTIDGMGTPGRSKPFLDISYGHYEEAGGLVDHVGVLQQLAAERPYMDLDRVGIYGHSAGGYGVVRAMLDFPEVYRVGVASAGNHDQALSNVTWGERWVGPPDSEAWMRQSNKVDVGNLQGKLLLITGDVDDNVNPAATIQLVAALIEANKDFDLLWLPNRNHDFVGTWGTWLEDPYLTRRRWDYFVEHLMGEEPPAGYRVAPPT